MNKGRPPLLMVFCSVFAPDHGNLFYLFPTVRRSRANTMSLVALMTARALGGVPEAFLVFGIPQLTPLALFWYPSGTILAKRNLG